MELRSIDAVAAIPGDIPGDTATDLCEIRAVIRQPSGRCQRFHGIAFTISELVLSALVDGVAP
jgi:hypothetical protein